LHFSLVMVGAHDGSKTENFIRRSAAMGNVLLVEPVPFLFNRLKSRFSDLPRIILRNIVIAITDGEVEFTAPTETANSITAWGDQLGSMVAGHAAAHDPRFLQHIEVIKAKALSFETLVNAENISSIDFLFTDTEGMDAELLPTFPFSRMMPNRLIFEFKHSDGPNRVGRKLASLLNFLDGCGYHVAVIDNENMMATHRTSR
jgi:FkbM family methyltransferase